MTGYRTSVVERVTGINAAVLHYWASTSFLVPSVQAGKGSGSRRLYSLSDIVAIRVVGELRSAGISLQSLRVVADALRARDVGVQPLNTFLATDGVEVYTRTGDDLVALLKEPGQRVLHQVVNLSRVIGEVHDAVLKLEQCKEGEQGGASHQAG